jgi:O-antigen/teichoic acid export membrane protein
LKRKFFTNLILLLSINVLIKPFWLLGIDRHVQVITGDAFGLYYSLLGLSATLNILLDMGITNYNNRNISRYNHLLPKHLGKILGIRMVLAVVYALVCFLWGYLAGYDKLQLHILSFLIVNQFLLQLILYLRSNLAALQLFTIDSLMSVLDRVFMIIFCGIILYTNLFDHQIKIEWFVYIQTLSYLLSALIILWIVLKKAGKIKVSFDLKFTLVFLRKTYPYAILVLLMSFYNRFDTVMMELILPEGVGNSQVGIYAHGYRILEAVSMFGVLFAGMLLPIFSKMLKTKESISDMVKFSFSLIMFISVSIAVVSFFYQEFIMNLMYRDHIEESAKVFGILMFGFIPITITYIFGTLLTANGSIKQLNLMAAFGMATNIGLNLLLIPQMGALGAAYSSLTTQTLTAIIQTAIAIFVFKFTPNPKFVIRVILFFALTLAITLASQKISSPFLGIVVAFLGITLSAFAIKLIDLKKLIELIMKR